MEHNIVNFEQFKSEKCLWTCEKLWNKTKEIIKPKFENSTSYKIWIEPVVPVKLEDNILTILFPKAIDMYIFDYKYQSKIEKEMYELTGAEYKLKLTHIPKVLDENVW